MFLTLWRMPADTSQMQAFAPSRRLAALALAAACVFLGATAAYAAAQAPLDSRALDDYHYDYAKRCSGRAQPGILALQRWISKRYIGESWGTYECRRVSGQGNWSLHAEGRALDWRLDAGIPKEKGEALKLIARLTAKDSQGRPDALARRMGVQEIIFNCRIWLPGSGFGRYRVCYDRRGRRIRRVDRTEAHKNHIHIGLNWAGARRKTSFWRYGYDKDPA